LYPSNTFSAEVFDQRFREILEEVEANAEELGISKKDIQKATRRNWLKNIVHSGLIDPIINFIQKRLRIINLAENKFARRALGIREEQEKKPEPPAESKKA